MDTCKQKENNKNKINENKINAMPYFLNIRNHNTVLFTVVRDSKQMYIDIVPQQ